MTLWLTQCILAEDWAWQELVPESSFTEVFKWNNSSEIVLVNCLLGQYKFRLVEFTQSVWSLICRRPGGWVGVGVLDEIKAISAQMRLVFGLSLALCHKIRIRSIIFLTPFPPPREQTKLKSSWWNQEFTETEIWYWLRSGTFSSLLVSVSVLGFKILELPGEPGSSGPNFWFNQELPG